MEYALLLIEMAALLLLTGAGAGVLAGLLGVGGGIVLVPAYFYVFSALGYAGAQVMQVCLGTSLATIIVTSTRSVLRHRATGAVDMDILRRWAPGLVIGAGLGVLGAAGLRSVTLQAIFGGLAFLVSLYMLLGRETWRLRETMPGPLGAGPLAAVTGFGSVLMGIGGGSFGVPVMSLMSVPIHRAVATAAGFGVLIAVPSVLGFLLLSVEPASRPPFTIGAVNLPAFGIVIAMTLVTTPLGVRLAHATDPGPLQKLFGGFLLLVALNMLRKAMGG